MSQIKRVVHKIGILEETDSDIYDKHCDNFDCHECIDVSSLCESQLQYLFDFNRLNE